MLARLSKNIVEWQIRKQTLAEEERAVYEYAYELLLNQTINIVIAILIAIVFQAPLTIIIFLISYIPLRSYSGGYHADTNWQCTLVSACMLCLVCWLVNKIMGWGIADYYPVIYIFSGFFVFHYAPVQDSNKPLDAGEIIRYRKISRILWIIEIIIGITFYFFQRQIGLVIAISHLFLSVILWMGIIKIK